MRGRLNLILPIFCPKNGEHLRERVRKVDKKYDEKFIDAKIYIILLNYKNYNDTIECLESLLRIDYSNFQIIVVDNSSPNDSMEKLTGWAKGEYEISIPEISPIKAQLKTPIKKPIPFILYTKEEAENGGSKALENKYFNPLIFIQSGFNGGFAFGNNIAIKYVLKKGDGKYILILNNDTVVEKNFLKHLYKTIEENPNIWIIGPKILVYNEQNRIWYVGAKFKLWRGDISHIDFFKLDNPKFRGVLYTDHVPGCALLTRCEIFEKVGLFDETYFLVHEDSDYSLRVKKKTDFAIAVNLNAIIWHKSGGISQTGKTNPISVYFATRNRFLIVFKHGNILEKFSFVIFYLVTRPIKFISLIKNGRKDLIKFEIKGILDFLRKIIWTS